MARKGHPARVLLDPTASEPLRRAVERLRASGLSGAEAAAEMLRKNFYDYMDAESDPESRPCQRLRIVKR